MDKIEAKRAFLKLAYVKFKNLPLYIEWAPEGALSMSKENNVTTSTNLQDDVKESIKKEEEEPVEVEPDTTLYLKNISFSTSEQRVKEVL